MLEHPGEAGDEGAGVLRVDHRAAAHVDADVVERGVRAGEEEQVAGEQVGAVHRGGPVELGDGVVRELHGAAAGQVPAVQGEPVVVEADGALTEAAAVEVAVLLVAETEARAQPVTAAPGVRHPELGGGHPDGLRAPGGGSVGRVRRGPAGGGRGGPGCGLRRTGGLCVTGGLRRTGGQGRGEAGAEGQPQHPAPVDAPLRARICHGEPLGRWWGYQDPGPTARPAITRNGEPRPWRPGRRKEAAGKCFDGCSGTANDEAQTPVRPPECLMTSAVRLIRNPLLTQAVDYAYAAAVDAPVRSLWLAGACPLDAEGRTVAVGDYEAQAHQVMRNLITVLEGEGAALTDLVRTTVYVASADRRDLVKVWRSTAPTWGVMTSPVRCWASRCWGTTASWSRWRRSPCCPDRRSAVGAFRWARSRRRAGAAAPNGRAPDGGRSLSGPWPGKIDPNP